MYGPNGFFREYVGNAANPVVLIQCTDRVLAPGKAELVLNLENPASQPLAVELVSNAHKHPVVRQALGAAGTKSSRATVRFPLADSFGWYDISIRQVDYPAFEQRYAGRVETGASSFSDPVMGGV